MHEVRSLSARLYMKAGEEVQKLLGHSSPRTTAIYTDFRDLEDPDSWKRVLPCPKAPTSSPPRKALLPKPKLSPIVGITDRRGLVLKRGVSGTIEVHRKVAECSTITASQPTL